MTRWVWAQHGTTVELRTEPGGAYALTIGDGLDDAAARSAELPIAAVREMLDHLVGAEGYAPLEGALEDLAAQEARAEAAETEAREATKLAKRLLGEVESLKTAGRLSDQRVEAAENERDAALLRADGLERDVARMRTAHDEVWG